MFLDEEENDPYFSSVLHSMWTLWLHVCLGEDFPSVANHVKDVNLLSSALLMVAAISVNLTLMNLLVGILVQVVSVVAVAEKEHMTVTLVKSQLQESFSELDPEGRHELTQDTFCKLLASREVTQVLTDVGIDVFAVLDLADAFFDGEDRICFSVFIEKILQLRGGNQATVKDMVDMRKFVMHEILSMEKVICASINGEEAIRQHGRLFSSAAAESSGPAAVLW